MSEAVRTFAQKVPGVTVLYLKVSQPQKRSVLQSAGSAPDAPQPLARGKVTKQCACWVDGVFFDPVLYQ